MTVTELRTSELMRRCARLLLAAGRLGSDDEVVRSHANELHGRAFLLDKWAIETAQHPSTDADDVLAKQICNVMLRAIGEVRS